METKRESVARLARCACGEPCFDRGNGHADMCEDCAHSALMAQAARIRELEGALRCIVARIVGDFDSDELTSYGPLHTSRDSDVLIIARRILAEGSVKP